METITTVSAVLPARAGDRSGGFTWIPSRLRLALPGHAPAGRRATGPAPHAAVPAVGVFALAGDGAMADVICTNDTGAAGTYPVIGSATVSGPSAWRPPV